MLHAAQSTIFMRIGTGLTSAVLLCRWSTSRVQGLCPRGLFRPDHLHKFIRHKGHSVSVSDHVHGILSRQVVRPGAEQRAYDDQTADETNKAQPRKPVFAMEGVAPVQRTAGKPVCVFPART
eukprot:CAMPEP_0198729274 /NCGR_PEP_ID=MMETSP1475-20131203/16523_1 /TAXON_ID= ORGANISM="Unidentified sp., Strain CCMP1999" /NCGR_SAMPLE_ID=MMETSP1475 /ASSEMBLY_ACC=CAM_ASM_001111 /LENGTH=121 /DNA_ID=CAMNT_0044491875 /DNA_START=269 /DNA_END=634 /DNA_ORIENTATION=+